MDPKKKVLIIDDDITFSQLASMILSEKGGFTISVCNQSVKAIEMIRSIKPDLILLDIVMPNIDGPEIAVKLQEDPQLKKIPVVFLTSLITGEEAATRSVRGNHKFVSKPISGEDLLKKVKGCFETGK